MLASFVRWGSPGANPSLGDLRSDLSTVDLDYLSASVVYFFFFLSLAVGKVSAV